MQEMLVFVAENSEVYRQQYIKLYDYIEEFIQKNKNMRCQVAQ